MYYILQCDLPENENGEALMEFHNCFQVGEIWHWRDGLALEPDEQDVPTPIVVEYETFRGHQGPPVDLVDDCIPLMSPRLEKSLLACGVDNLCLFDVQLKNRTTNETREFKAFKLVGLVAMADLGGSDWSSFDNKPAVDVSFKSLAVDESLARGQLMFRLAENINALMVHESVRDALIADGIDTLSFIEPKDWVQI